MSHSYKQALEKLQQRIEKACASFGRDPSEITLIAVSKTHPVDAVRDVHALGQVHFGENKVQELVPKMEETADLTDIEWHMIGVLQTNKIKHMAGRVDWIHSVPKLKALKEINKRAAENGRVINVLIQVNISDEDQKSGCAPEEVPGLIEAAEQMENLVVRGLMGMASFVDDMDVVGNQFRFLKEILETEKKKPYKRAQLEHLSMGMSHDLEAAIKEGATMLRVGTAVFGERDYGE